MADVTATANLALSRLGVGQAIASLSENSVPAKALNRVYVQCRQEVLRAFPWGFATKAEALAVASGQEFPGWGYVYQYPNGCLNMRAVADEGGIRNLGALVSCCDPSCWSVMRRVRRPWQKALKDDGASQVLLTDVGDAWGYYTTDVTNAGAWDIDFASVLAWKWAAEVAGPINARAEFMERAETRYAIFQSQAAAASMNEQKDDPQAEPESIACRY